LVIFGRLKDSLSKELRKWSCGEKFNKVWKIIPWRDGGCGRRIIWRTGRKFLEYKIERQFQQ
jgi:hypothetical protein